GRHGLRRGRRRPLPRALRIAWARDPSGCRPAASSTRPLPCPHRLRIRARRRGGADLRSGARRGPGVVVTVELRAIEADDLDRVEEIEREAYPTPWSRSMFVAELAKPSSLCLGAYTSDDGLAGYLIVSRYVDAWHVMNIAVASGFRRRGIASALLERLF